MAPPAFPPDEGDGDQGHGRVPGHGPWNTVQRSGRSRELRTPDGGGHVTEQEMSRPDARRHRQEPQAVAIGRRRCGHDDEATSGKPAITATVMAAVMATKCQYRVTLTMS